MRTATDYFNVEKRIERVTALWQAEHNSRLVTRA